MKLSMLLVGGFILSVIGVPSCPLEAEVFLPGMQPEEGGIEFAKVQQCRMCHSGTKNGDADPFLSWQGSMMAQAMRDPVFLASLAIANQDIPDVGEFCLRCHSPRGWLEGRSTPADGSALNEEDKQGVSCDVCHRLVDPMSEEAKAFAKQTPPSPGNAMMVVDTANAVRGPYGNGEGAMPHNTLKSEYHASGQLCGNCHDISNPTLAMDVNSQPVFAYGHIERTYSEWLLSDYAKQGKDGSCQSCHYLTVPGGGTASRFGGLKRDHFVVHGPVGSSLWVQDATWMAWKGKGMDKAAFALAKKRTEALLKTAATLKLTFPGTDTARLRVTNETGHKLPTGYIEGRRTWINVKCYDRSGKMIREIGRYGDLDDTIFGKAVRVPTLLDPEQTTVYECLPGISEAQAKKYGKQPGKSFHFVLNDVILKDNRIPPRGFKNSTFKAHLSEPVGAEYKDGQYWDEQEFELPDGCVKVSVSLMMQSMSWEYLKFLAEENKTNDWGTRLYQIWTQTGKCPPVVVASVEASVPAE
jgi:hypothetical protein